MRVERPAEHAPCLVCQELLTRAGETERTGGEPSIYVRAAIHKGRA
jgi:hypothetical protein